MAILAHNPTRRGILGALAMAPAAIAVPALAARSDDGWSQLSDVMALQHPEGREMVANAKAAGMKVSQLFCIIIGKELGQTNCVCFTDETGVDHRFYPPSETRQ